MPPEKQKRKTIKNNKQTQHIPPLLYTAESISEEGLQKLIGIIENQLALSGVIYKFTI